MALDEAKRTQPPSLEIFQQLPDGWTETPETGLTHEQAEERARAGLSNTAPISSGRTWPRVLAKHLFTLFNLLNVVLAVALALVGAYRNMLFLGVIVTNTLIGTVQELRARATVNRLKLQSNAPIQTLRDGHDASLPVERLVQGDLVRLHAGDQVPADAIVRSGIGAVDESMLTGESDAMEKQHGDWMMSGSYVLSGSFVAQLVYVGESSYLNRLTAAARAIRQPRSELLSELKRLVRYLTFVLVPLGILLFLRQWRTQGQPLEQAVPRTVAAVIGMLPEGLVLLTSVALMVGVMRLGKKGTLVSELFGIENLARVDTLCLDKTGTLTTGDMYVEKILPLGVEEDEFRRQLSRFLGAFECDSHTLKALAASCPPVHEPVSLLVPFSSATKYSAVTLESGETLILGAPSFVMTPEQHGETLRLAEEAASKGLRVVAFLKSEQPLNNAGLPEDRQPIGLAMLCDGLRPNLQQTLRYFDEQGVTLRVISGDDPGTVRNIAARAGIPHAERSVDVSKLSDEELEKACEDCVVFGRVTPDRKRALVEYMKKSGHSVAMTGDGVNDIPAMKAADCSIAMGNGSDAARRTAQITLLNNDFDALPKVVGEGRRVINNITRAASLFLVKTLYSFAISLVLLLYMVGYPFQPIHLTLISTLTIGIPSFFLAFESNQERVKGRFLKRVIQGALPSAAAVTACALFVMGLERSGWTSAECSTLACLAAAAMGLLALLLVCIPFTKLRLTVWISMTAAMFLAVVFAPKVFYLERLEGKGLLILLGLTAAGTLITLIFHLLIRIQKRGFGKKRLG